MKKSEKLTYTMLTKPDVYWAEELFKTLNDETNRIIEREELPKEAWDAFIAEGKDPAKRRMKYAETYYDPRDLIAEIRGLDPGAGPVASDIDYEAIEKEKEEDRDLLSSDDRYSLRWK